MGSCLTILIIWNFENFKIWIWIFQFYKFLMIWKFQKAPNSTFKNKIQIFTGIQKSIHTFIQFQIYIYVCNSFRKKKNQTFQKIWNFANFGNLKYFWKFEAYLKMGKYKTFSENIKKDHVWYYRQVLISCSRNDDFLV